MTVIGTLEDAEDYQAFETAIIADYDAQSAVERELVLRLASLLWRLRRATTMQTGLFEIQANHLSEFRHAREALLPSREVIPALLRTADGVSCDRDSAKPNSIGPAIDPTVELALCFLRLANLPNFAIDRLSRYEASLWRQTGQVLYALDALDQPQTTRTKTPPPCRYSAKAPNLCE